MAKALHLEGGAFSLDRDEGEAIKVNQIPYYVKLSSKQTNGRFMMMEGVVLPGEGPLAHIHHFEDEVFYVVEGELQFNINNKTITAPQGTCVFSPRGDLHAFRNNANRTDPKPARLQFWFSPGDNILNYLEQAGRVLHQNPPNFDLLKKLAKEWGIDIIGPANWDNNA